jgi:predicted nucleic acid-binding protein
MMKRRIFMDTSYVQARISHRDKFHAKAVEAARQTTGAEAWITEAVLIEIGDSFGASDRRGTIEFIEMCYRATHIRVVRLTSELLSHGFALYKARPDKEWGLTDCISFVVMEDHGLTDALTADRHFVQAGFRALLLET